MQFIETQDAFQLFDVYCDCESEDSDEKNLFESFQVLLVKFRFEIWSESKFKKFSLQLFLVFILPAFVPEDKKVFLVHRLMCQMNDCLEQIEKSFIKTEKEVETTKKGWEKVELCVFFFMSHKRPNHMLPRWNS